MLILSILAIKKSLGINYQYFKCAESASCKVLNVFNVTAFNRYMNLNSYVDNVYGQNTNFTEINSVSFIHSKFKEMPDILTEKLINLKKLDVSDTNLVAVTDETISKLQKLEKINLRGNQIKNLEDSTFRNLPNLKFLDLSDNQLNEFPKNLLENCRDRLEILKLRNNSITKMEDSNLSKFKNLRELDISSNKIENVDGTFENCCAKMEILDLSENRIKEISEETFIFYQKRPSNSYKNTLKPNPTQLNLCKNELQTFHCNFVLDELILAQNHINNIELSSCNVKKLDASDNKLTTITLNQYITVLNIRNNKITDVACSAGSNLLDVNFAGNQLSKDSFKCFAKNVTILDFSNNNLGSLNSQTFQGYNCFQVLKLQHTQITSVGYGTFYYQRDLEYLDLSGNLLTTINFNSFAFCDRLRTFYCGGNQLVHIQNVEIIRVYMKNIQVIEISQNNWNCTYLERVLKSLHEQNVKVIVVNPVKDGPNINGISCQDSNAASTTTLAPQTTKKPLKNPDNCQASTELIKEKLKNLKQRLEQIRENLKKIQMDLETALSNVEMYLAEF